MIRYPKSSFCRNQRNKLKRGGSYTCPTKAPEKLKLSTPQCQSGRDPRAQTEFKLPNSNTEYWIRNFELNNVGGYRQAHRHNSHLTLKDSTGVAGQRCVKNIYSKYCNLNPWKNTLKIACATFSFPVSLVKFLKTSISHLFTN